MSLHILVIKRIINNQNNESQIRYGLHVNRTSVQVTYNFYYNDMF